jgi:hypothetical protein
MCDPVLRAKNLEIINDMKEDLIGFKEFEFISERIGNSHRVPIRGRTLERRLEKATYTKPQNYNYAKSKMDTINRLKAKLEARS